MKCDESLVVARLCHLLDVVLGDIISRNNAENVGKYCTNRENYAKMASLSFNAQN